MENWDQFVVISPLLIRYGAGTCFGTGEQETAVPSVCVCVLIQALDRKLGNLGWFGGLGRAG